jgi:hypothetical protein
LGVLAIFSLVSGFTGGSILCITFGLCSQFVRLQSTRRISSWLPALFPLAAGSHTFTMQYAATGGTGNFSANYLKVQPL